MRPPPDAACRHCGADGLVRRRVARWPSFEHFALKVGLLGSIAGCTALVAVESALDAPRPEPIYGGGAGFAGAGSVFVVLAAFLVVVVVPLFALLWWWLGRRAALVCAACGERASRSTHEVVR